ncbi:MAG: hypothetical protein HQRvContig02_59, partial [Haloquadratum phage sp.]
AGQSAAGQIGTESEPVDVEAASVAAQSVSTSKTYTKTTPTVNVKNFGAVGDGATDDTAAIDDALAHASDDQAAVLYFPSGAYLYNGSIGGIAGNLKSVIGDNEKDSTIKFTDSTVNYLIKPFDGQSVSSWRMENIRVEGPGKSAGTNIHGIDTRGANFPPFNIEFKNVRVSDVSGDGWRLTESGANLFSWSLINCTPENIGRHGIQGVAGNTCYVRGFGRYSRNIDGWLMWIHSGRPTIQTVNAENVGTDGVEESGGLKFGRDSSHPSGSGFASPEIRDVNLEPVTGEYGVKFEVGSAPTVLDRVSIFAPDGGTLTNGVYYGGLQEQTRHEGVSYNALGTGSYGSTLTINSGGGGILSSDPQPSNLGNESNTSARYTTISSALEIPFSGAGLASSGDFIATDSAGKGLLVEDADGSGNLYRIRVNAGAVDVEGPL